MDPTDSMDSTASTKPTKPINPIDTIDDRYKDNIPDGWDWNAKLPQWTWHDVSLDGYPGWETDENSGDQSPSFILAELVYTKDFSTPRSRDMAIAIDDVADALFYYRDWTSDGLPTVADGDTHWAGFWFQTQALGEVALQLIRDNGIAATASWESDFDDRRSEMDRRRESRDGLEGLKPDE